MERNFDRHIGYYIQETARILTRVHNEMLSRHGISFAQFRVLNCLWETDGMNQSEIADMLHITPASLSALLNLLVKKGLLERRVDENDTRSRRIYLTENGVMLKKVSWEIIESLEAVLAESFSGAEKELLLEWLKAAMGNIQAKETAMQQNPEFDPT